MGRVVRGRPLGDLGRGTPLRAADRPHRRAARSRRGGHPGAAAAGRRLGVAFAGRARLPGRPRHHRPQPQRGARRSESDPGLASRPSDEPFVSVRFGCDDPPQRSGDRSGAAGHRSAPASFLRRRTAAGRSPGAARSRSDRARSCSRPARSAGDAGTEAILAAIERLAPFDLVTVIVPRGEPEAIERARLLALRQPGRVALLLSGSEPGGRALRPRRRRRDSPRRRSRSNRTFGRPGPALRDAPHRPRRGRQSRLSGRLRSGLPHRPGDPLQRRHAVRDRERRPPRARPCGPTATSGGRW